MTHLLVNNSDFDYTIKIGNKLVKIESKKSVEVKQEYISELNKKVKNFNGLFITSKKEEVKKDEKKTENKKEDKKSENKTEETK